MSRRQIISSAEATPASKQLTKPCSDCPFSREAVPGWLGGATPDEYRQLAESDLVEPCHVHPNVQCAGLAIYRANTCKVPRDRAALRLPADRERVFARSQEFLDHHSKPGRPRR